MRTLFLLAAGVWAGCGPSSLDGAWGPPPPSPNVPESMVARSGAATTDSACEGDLEAMSTRVGQARAAHVGRVPSDLSPPEVTSAVPPDTPGIRLVVRPGSVHLHTWKYGPKELEELHKTLETERRIGGEMASEGGRSLDYVDVWADRAVPVLEIEKLVAAIPAPLQARLVVLRTEGGGAIRPAAPPWVHDLAAASRDDPHQWTEALLTAFGRAGGGCQPLADTLEAARDRARPERLPFVLRVAFADVLECGCKDVELPALEGLMRAATDTLGERSGYLPLQLSVTGREVAVPKEATVADLAKALVAAKIVEQPGPVHIAAPK